ncbi:MAG TPA: hypothetical protein VKT18_04340, partial [Acidimicrobiales bacterium]|nr:hypothetical protein [Acidimicrobiales bacterium]
MKKSLVAAVALAAPLTLAACGGGGSPSASNTTTTTGGGSGASLTSLVQTVNSSSDLQVQLSASGTGFASAKDEALVKDFTVDLNFQSTNGAPLSTAGANKNAELTVNAAGTPLFDLRVIGTKLYVNLELTALSGLPGVNLPAATLQEVQLVFGGKWLEIPESLLTKNLPKSGATSTAKATQDRAAAVRFIGGLESALESASRTSLPGGGYKVTGTLLSLANALLPTIRQIDPAAKLPTANSAKGTYAVTVQESNSSLTSLTISVTAPVSTGHDATGSTTLTFAHANTSIAVPANAQEISPTLLHELEGVAGTHASTVSATSGPIRAIRAST